MRGAESGEAEERLVYGSLTSHPRRLEVLYRDRLHLILRM